MREQGNSDHLQVYKWSWQLSVTDVSQSLKQFCTSYYYTAKIKVSHCPEVPITSQRVMMQTMSIQYGIIKKIFT